ncbi:MAG: hypothetical protein O7G88_20675 [bacterium]|nr:hypothetical protein [bacterium]
MKTFTSPAAVTPRFLMGKQTRPAITMTLYDLMATRSEKPAHSVRSHRACTLQLLV